MSVLNDQVDVRVYYCRNVMLGGRLPEALVRLGRVDGVTVEAVPCGGRIDPRYILKSFESGAEAVCVLTCPVSHCKLMEGNLRAARRVELARELLAEAGLNANALQLISPNATGQAELESAIEEVVHFVDSRAKQLVGQL